jgi:thiol-disulfide isomerase/thioredoxin
MRATSSLIRTTLALATLLLVSTASAALEQKAYDAAAFKDAQAAGKPVAVHISAPWCPTCKEQHQVIDDLAKNPEYADLTLFEVDFDGQKDVVKGFGATMQSTIIAFSGPKETGRLVGDASPEGIGRVLTSSLQK